jgi:hypothetical protein
MDSIDACAVKDDQETKHSSKSNLFGDANKK